MRAPTFVSATLLVLVSILAGCTSSPEETTPTEVKRAGGRVIDKTPIDAFSPDWAELALPFGEGHDHHLFEHHANVSTPNFHLIAHDPLITDYYGTSAGDYFCGDVRQKDNRTLAVIESFGSDVAFVIIDVTDSANPEKIGELVMAQTHEYDIAMTPDQNYILLSTWPFDSGPDTPAFPLDEETPLVQYRDACTGETSVLLGPEASLPFTSGIVLVDISNPRNAVVMDFLYFPPTGGHSIQVEDLDGETIILLSSLNFEHQASYYVFLEIQEVAGRAKLFILSVYQYPSTDSVPPPTTSSLHDGYLQKHPITGDHLAYLAYTGTGLVILNIDDPTMPVLVTRWQDDNDDLEKIKPNGMGLHGVIPAKELWDGRHYSVVGEECGNHPSYAPTCLVAVLDTTDPAKPFFVGAWTLPADVQWEYAYSYSPHYFDLVGRTLFISTYHGGVWAVDLSTETALRNMPSIGAFLPDRESPKPPQNYRSAANQAFLTALSADLTLAPMVMDVNPLPDGNLIVWDNTSGLYVVYFDADSPAPAPAPWDLGYPLK